MNTPSLRRKREVCYYGTRVLDDPYGSGRTVPDEEFKAMVGLRRTPPKPSGTLEAGEPARRERMGLEAGPPSTLALIRSFRGDSRGSASSIAAGSACGQPMLEEGIGTGSRDGVVVKEEEQLDEAAELQRSQRERCLRWGPPAPDRPDIRAATQRGIRSFFSSVTMRAAGNASSSGAGAGSGGSRQRGASVQTFSVGDCVLMDFLRGNVWEEAPLTIEALFEDNSGVACLVPRWELRWEDLIDAYDEPRRPDGAMRGRREVFRLPAPERTQGGANLVLENLDADINPVVNVLRHATLRHHLEVEGYLQAYELLPDAFWYRYSFDTHRLRWEYLPPPRTAAAAAAAGAGAAAPPRPTAAVTAATAAAGTSTAAGARATAAAAAPTMLDVFCGLGTVALAAQEAGFKVVGGVEKDPDAASSFCANLPGLPDPHMSVAQFVAAVKRREPQVPGPGAVTYIHLSPPCQSLSPMNGYRSYHRYQEELIPLLRQCVELIEVLQPDYVSMEEVVQFLFSILPVYRDEEEAERREEERRRAAKLARGEGGVAGSRRYSSEGLSYRADWLSPKVTVRPWLHIIPPLLCMGYQVDLSILNAAHYGVPQGRKRAFLLAARCGLPLPLPPLPRYHSPYRKPKLREDSSLLYLRGGWKSLTPCTEGQGLPAAVTVGEAISDLPSLLPPEGASEAVVPAAGPNGRRPLQLGKTCTPYRPLDIPGPYAQFMRRGAGHNLMHHSLRANLPVEAPLGAAQLFPTVHGRAWGFAHFVERRLLTLAERKRAQSIPDRVQLVGSREELERQVGNAVPFLLARAVADVIWEAATGRPACNPVPCLKAGSGSRGTMAAGTSAHTAGAAGAAVARHGAAGQQARLPLPHPRQGGAQPQQEPRWQQERLQQPPQQAEAERPATAAGPAPHAVPRTQPEARLPQQWQGGALPKQKRRWQQRYSLQQQHAAAERPATGAGPAPNAVPPEAQLLQPHQWQGGAQQQQEQRWQQQKQKQQQQQQAAAWRPATGAVPAPNAVPPEAQLLQPAPTGVEITVGSSGEEVSTWGDSDFAIYLSDGEASSEEEVEKPRTFADKARRTLRATLHASKCGPGWGL